MRPSASAVLTLARGNRTSSARLLRLLQQMLPRTVRTACTTALAPWWRRRPASAGVFDRAPRPHRQHRSRVADSASITPSFWVTTRPARPMMMYLMACLQGVRERGTPLSTTSARPWRAPCRIRFSVTSSTPSKRRSARKTVSGSSIRKARPTCLSHAKRPHDGRADRHQDFAFPNPGRAARRVRGWLRPDPRPSSRSCAGLGQSGARQFPRQAGASLRGVRVRFGWHGRCADGSIRKHRQRLRLLDELRAQVGDDPKLWFAVNATAACRFAQGAKEEMMRGEPCFHLLSICPRPAASCG